MIKALNNSYLCVILGLFYFINPVKNGFKVSVLRYEIFPKYLKVSIRLQDICEFYDNFSTPVRSKAVDGSIENTKTTTVLDHFNVSFFLFGSREFEFSPWRNVPDERLKGIFYAHIG